MNDHATIEWVVLRDDTVVIAHESGQWWVTERSLAGEIDPFAAPMTCPGTPGSTAALLNGAVAAGFGTDKQYLGDCIVSLPKYILNLVGAYHNARRTPGNYRKAAARLREWGRDDIAHYLETHAKEETGHERLALKDFRSLGLPGERLVENLFPDGAMPMVELFDRLSSADYPVGCIGYSYCLESTAATKQKADVDAMQALCPEGVNATRFLKAHSSLGNEVDHVRDMIAFIASLPASDRIEIARAAYETAVLTAGLRRDLHKSDEAIWGDIQAAVGEDLALPA